MVADAFVTFVVIAMVQSAERVERMAIIVIIRGIFIFGGGADGIYVFGGI